MIAIIPIWVMKTMVIAVSQTIALITRIMHNTRNHRNILMSDWSSVEAYYFCAVLTE